eukprot:jgi/Ulvmu1/269/UM001_0273.1
MMLCTSTLRNLPTRSHRQPTQLTAWSRWSGVKPTAEPPGSGQPYPAKDPPYPAKDPTIGDEESPKKRVFSHALNENFAAEELIDELRDKKGFGQRGEVVVLAQIVLTFLVIFPPMQLKGLIFMCGALALIFGAISVVLSFLGLGKSFSPLITPRKANSIITSGMFQYMRHPLYAGLIWLGFGLSAVTYSETRFVMSCMLFSVLNYKAGKEEEAMLEKHGDDYAKYMQQLQRFIPTL